MRTEELSDKSMGDLVQRLSQQTATLVRQEMRLAQAELQEKGKRAGLGAGMFGAGVLGLLGKKQVDQATPPKPEQAIESVQDDVEHVKERARR